MTAKKKVLIHAKRHKKAAAGAVKSIKRKLSHAELQEQNAELQTQNAEQQAQIARLQAQNARLKGVPPIAGGEENSRLTTRNAQRRVHQSAEKVQSIDRKHPYAQIDAHPYAQIDAHPYAQPYSQMDAQLATIEEKIAALQAQRADMQAQSAVQQAQIAERNAQNAPLQAQNARLQAQLAMQQEQNAQMQAQIAMLMGQVQSSTFNVPSGGQVQSSTFNVPSGDQVQSSTFNAQGGNQFQSSTFNARSRDHVQSSTFNSQSRENGLNAAFPRANLPAPVLGDVVANGPNSITLHWGSVANASAYIVSVADNSAFDEANLFSAGPAAVSWTVNGLEPNTTYYVRVRANGSGEYGNSAYSASKSITTTGVGGGGGDGGGGGGGGGGNGGGDGIAGNDNIADDLQNWLSELQATAQNIMQLVPQLDNTKLNSEDRRRLNGSGVRRYGFIEKVLNVSSEYQQFWPSFSIGAEGLSNMVQEIEVLRNLLIWARWCARAVQDLLLITGDDAFRAAGMYYATARDGARRKNPEALQVYNMLRLYWRRRRRIMAEPTEKEMLRDAKGLMHGTKDGDLILCNESDRIVKGNKVMIDNTFPANQRASMKVTEEDEETGAGAEWFDRTGTPGSKAGGRELGERRKKKRNRR